MSEMLRPATAAARFQVCERTLSRWARSGLIGRSQVGAAVFYDSGDIADLIARNTTKRTVVPMAATPAATAPDWRDDSFWQDAAPPTAAAAARGRRG